MSNNTIQRKMKKKSQAQKIAVLEARVNDHARAINMSALAHEGVNNMLSALLEKLDLEIKQDDKGVPQIVSKSGIVTLEEVKKGL